jgi:hypothetical protein
VVALFLTMRTSSWLVPVDAIVALVALVLAASYAGGGSLVGVTGTTLVVRLGRTFLSIVLAPAFLLGALAAAVPARTPERRARAVAVGRGVGLAVPALVVLGLLLASADAVFGALFTVPFDLPTAAGHGAIVACGLLVGSFLLVEASSPAVREVGLDARPLGATEATIVLGGVVALYGVFAAVQVVVAAQGEDAVLRAAGVTYAEHARQGFFQLLAVAALTVAILVALRAFTEAGSRAARLRLVVLSEVAIALTLVIVGVAITRLGLYEQAFGLTMLRCACTWSRGGSARVRADRGGRDRPGRHPALVAVRRRLSLLGDGSLSTPLIRRPRSPAATSSRSRPAIASTGSTSLSCPTMRCPPSPPPSARSRPGPRSRPVGSCAVRFGRRALRSLPPSGRRPPGSISTPRGVRPTSPERRCARDRRPDRTRRLARRGRPRGGRRMEAHPVDPGRPHRGRPRRGRARGDRRRHARGGSGDRSARPVRGHPRRLPVRGRRGPGDRGPARGACDDRP